MVRRLLVLDTSYSLEAIRSRKLETSVTCRDLDGYFDEVWTVHPFATLVTTPSWSSRWGGPVATRLSPRHVFVEGKVGRFQALARFPSINFVLSQFGMLWHLCALVRRRRIDVVRAGDPLVLGLYGWVVARCCRIPLVIRVGGNNEKVRQDTGRPIMPRLLRFRGVERAIERFVLARTDLIAAANEDNRRYAVAMGAPAERTTLFRYGNLIHAMHFSDPASRGDASGLLDEVGLDGRQFLLFIGRLEPVKMADHAVRALASVRRGGHDVELLVVGTGSIQRELERLAEELGVSGHVIFAGDRDQPWIARVVPQAAAVLSPHTGRALCEAALGGAPIVAYDIDWQGELIESGVSGELVECGRVEAMASAAAGLLNNRQYARQLGSHARLKALEMLDPQRLNEHEKSEYTRLLDRQR